MIQDFQVHVLSGAGRGFTPAPWRNVYAVSADLVGMLVANDEGTPVMVYNRSLRICAGSICQVEGCSMSLLCVVCRKPNCFLTNHERSYVCLEHFDPTAAAACPRCDLPREDLDRLDRCTSANCPMNSKETAPNG